VLVFAACPSKGLMKSIVIARKTARSSLFIVTSSFEVVLESILDLTKLDACPSEKVYKKIVYFILALPYLH
jgi:hypothetical protein